MPVNCLMKSTICFSALAFLFFILRDICASTLTTEQKYDPSITYNVYTVQDLQGLYTNVDVPKMLKTLRVDGQDKYIVMDVEQAKKINSLLVEENLQALKDYSTFVMLNDTAEYANANYAKLSDDMQNALYGITESWGDEKTWKKLTQDMLPWDFGMIYVKEHFSAKDKEAVEEMIEQILEEYEEIINRQEWMSEATRKKAIRKLETMQVHLARKCHYQFYRKNIYNILLSYDCHNSFPFYLLPSQVKTWHKNNRRCYALQIAELKSTHFLLTLYK